MRGGMTPLMLPLIAVVVAAVRAAYVKGHADGIRREKYLTALRSRLGPPS